MDEARFIGGMNVPALPGGRLNATMPFAVLTIDSDALTLHFRPFPIPTFSDFRVLLSNVATAFRLWGSPLAVGIGIELSDGQVAYFWTWRQEAVLAALGQRGIPIDPAPRRAVGSLRGQFILYRRPTKVPDVADLPGLSRQMMLIAPALLVAGIAIAAWFVSMGGASGWFVIPIAGLSLFNAWRMWTSSRTR